MAAVGLGGCEDQPVREFSGGMRQRTALLVLQLGLIVLMWIQVRQRSNELNAEWFADISFIFPLIGVIFTWLAIRGIVKDITLLKSFDRIR